MSSRLRAWTLFLVLLPAMTGCGGKPGVRPEDLNVLLITLDTTRADQFGCYGNTLGLTPNLDQLAAEGVVFEEAVSPVPLTLPAHCSIHTGLYPIHNGVRINGWFRLPQEHVTLAEVLKEAGFSTGAVISSYVLDRQFDLGQGFDTYDDDLTHGFQKTEFSTIERRGDTVTESGLRWLEKNGNGRFFLWLHYYDPHYPYDPPSEFAKYGDGQFQRYQGEIAYMDDNIGRILAKLRETGQYDRTLIIAVGDHGEAFGEKEEYGHGLFIYRSTLHVPLIVRAPRVEGLPFQAGTRVGGRVSLVDLMPTVLQIVGKDLPAPVDGRSLVPFLTGREKTPAWDIYAEAAMGKLTKNWSQLGGIYSGAWKYILAPTPELYNLRDDIDEGRNLAGQMPSEADRMRALFVQLVSRPATFPGSATFQMDEEAENRLRSLGYISASSIPKEQLDELQNNLIEACVSGPDPKEMMPYTNLVTAAMGHLTAGQPGRALRTLKEARDLLGGKADIELLAHMASAYVQLKLFDSAIETYQEILKVHPTDAGMLNNLALVYNQKGQSQKAVEIMKEVIARAPTFYDYHLNLANIYDDLRRYDLADRSYATALELAPTTAGKREGVRYNIALSYVRRGRFADARSLLEDILRERPDYEEARTLLGQVPASPTPGA